MRKILAAALLLVSTLGTVPSRTVQPLATFRSGMLRVERFGNPKGHAVILIPGLFCGSWEWNGQIAALAPTNDIYAVTLPGMDGLPRTSSDKLMERTVASISQLIRERKLDRPIVVGHSLGATTAVLFGETYPDEAGAIVALEGGFPIAPTAAARVKNANDQAKPYENADANTFAKVLRTATLQYTITSEDDVNTVAHLAARTDPNAAADWLKAALSRDLTPNLSRIHVPFTEIVPFDPAIDPYAGYKTLAAKRAAYVAFVNHAPRGRVIIISPARHFEMFDQPKAVNTALRELIPR
jgi:pimeloyl-ACP methyl ester carboxylesterase